jgi:hypothetical protein
MLIKIIAIAGCLTWTKAQNLHQKQFQAKDYYAM